MIKTEVFNCVVKRIRSRENSSNIFAPEAIWRRFPISRDRTLGRGCFIIKMNHFIPAKHGRLTPIEKIVINKRTSFLCRCDCGKEKIVNRDNLVSGRTQSCGCLQSEVRINTHSIHRNSLKGKETGAYKSWKNMISRCYNPSNNRFKHYGGRGIRVCDRWLHSFVNFLSDMGPRPIKHSIERKKNDADYEKENCVWATPKEQQNHRRNNHFLTINGLTKTISQWSDISGIKTHTICGRLKMGWNSEMAVFKKLRGEL